MAIANLNSGRQFQMTAMQAFELSEVENGVAIAAVKVPTGALVTGGQLVVTEVFNSTTSDTISVGDTDATDTLLAATDVQAAGVTQLTGEKFYANGDTLTIEWTSGGGVPTTGAGYVVINYVVAGRSNEVQP